jgi:hypothetical protein
MQHFRRSRGQMVLHAEIIFDCNGDAVKRRQQGRGGRTVGGGLGRSHRVFLGQSDKGIVWIGGSTLEAGLKKCIGRGLLGFELMVQAANGRHI